MRIFSCLQCNATYAEFGELVKHACDRGHCLVEVCPHAAVKPVVHCMNCGCTLCAKCYRETPCKRSAMGTHAIKPAAGA